MMSVSPKKVFTWHGTFWDATVGFSSKQ